MVEVCEEKDVSLEGVLPAVMEIIHNDVGMSY